MNAHNCVNMIGKRIGRLSVVESAPSQNKRAMWKCVCDCGNETIACGKDLRSGNTKSCGCLMRECQYSIENTSRLTRWIATHSHPCLTHGEARVGKCSRRFTMFHAAKKRAKKRGLAFDLKFTEMPLIPKLCPVLGLTLEKGIKTLQPNSPTLDRISDSLGYTNGNIRIISYRANLLKNNANSDELSSVLKDAIEIEQSEVDSFALS